MTTSTPGSVSQASSTDHGRLIFAAEIDGPFLALSGNWEAAFGRPISELMQSRRKDLFHPEDLPLAAQWCVDILADGSGLPLRTRANHPTLGYRIFEWEAVTISDTRVILGVGREVGATESPPTQLTLRDGEITLDTRARTAYARDQELDFTAIEFDLLRLLLERRGSVLSADAIADAIWGYEQTGSRNFLQAHISRLRKKLHAAAVDDPITTIRGVGYVIR